jgi:hypothetical protein
MTDRWSDDLDNLKEIDAMGVLDDRALLEVLQSTGIFTEPERRDVLARYRHTYGERRMHPDALKPAISALLELLDGSAPESDVMQVCLDCGYDSPLMIEAILGEWRKMGPPPVECSVCTDPATHLYAVIDVNGRLHSMKGEGVFAPSCDGCDDPSVDPGEGFWRVTVPLGATVEQDLRSPQQIVSDWVEEMRR